MGALDRKFLDFITGRYLMNALKLVLGSLTLLSAGLAQAAPALPLDDSGLIVVAASALVAVIGIARRKQQR